jgi:hypothetical protein
VDSAQPERVLEADVIGRFGWTEIGALDGRELAHML